MESRALDLNMMCFLSGSVATLPLRFSILGAIQPSAIRENPYSPQSTI
jgi:hypothetical protein